MYLVFVPEVAACHRRPVGNWGCCVEFVSLYDVQDAYQLAMTTM